MTSDEYEAEIERLHAMVLAVSQRLFLAAEVLSIRAERKKKAEVDAPAVVWVDGGVATSTDHSRTVPYRASSASEG